MKKILLCIGILSLPEFIWSATPTFVQGTITPGAGAFNIAKTTVPLLNPSQSGNFLMCASVTGASGNTFTFSDDKANYWNKTVQINDAGNGASLQIGFSSNVAASTQKIVTNLGDHSYGQVAVQEYYNVAIGSVADGESGRVTSGTSLSAGTINPSTDGDMLLTVAVLDNWSGRTKPIVWTPMPGCRLYNLHGSNYMAVQTCIQVVKAATDPFITSNYSAPSAMVKTIAIKSASQGSDLASGIKVRKLNIETLDNVTAYATYSPGTSFSFQVDVVGNLIALLYNGRPATPVNTITSEPALTWVNDCIATSGGSGNIVAGWHAANVSVGITSITVGGFSATPNTGIFNFFDVSGADSTSPFDICSTTNATNNTVNTGGIGDVTITTITPVNSNGVVLQMTQEDRHTVVNTTPGYFVTPTVDNYASNDFTTDQGLSIYYNPNTSLVSHIATYEGKEGGGVGPGAYCSIAMAFKAQAIAPIIVLPGTRLRGVIMRGGIIR